MLGNRIKATYVQTFQGKFEVRSKTQTDETVSRKTKSGETIHVFEYEWIEGRIKDIRKNVYEGDDKIYFIEYHP